jgi:hypothetical protein
VKEDLDPNPENIDFILKSAEKSDKVIIAWGKLGENRATHQCCQTMMAAR